MKKQHGAEGRDTRRDNTDSPHEWRLATYRDAVTTPDAVQRVLDALEAGGFNPRKNGNGWIARCPGHEDHNPSLSVREGRGGRALLRCWAGCDTRVVLRALGLGWPDLFAGPCPTGRRRA